MKKKLYIAGQEGMVGSAILKVLKKKFKIINCLRKELDLVDQNKVDKWFKKNKPDIVVNAAGRVGGILDNATYIDEYIYTNSRCYWKDNTKWSQHVRNWLYHFK